MLIQTIFSLLLCLPAQAQVESQGWIGVPDDNEVLVQYGSTSYKVFAHGDQIRLISWNLHKLGDDQAYQDIKKFSSSSDLLLFQESMMGKPFGRFFTAIKDFEWLGAISFFEMNGDGTGVSTGSPYLLSAVKYVRSEAREPIIHTPKMIVLTKYPVKNSREELLVANIHGINFVSTAAFASQIQQLEKAIQNHKGPMVVAGDFNTRNLERIFIVRGMADRLHLDWVKMDDDHRSVMIDHIFARGFKRLSGRIMNEIKSSDHEPLNAVMELL